MTAEQFAYWLQGFAELNGAAPNAEQWKSIQDHLSLVLHKVTPPVQSLSSIDWTKQICQAQGGSGILTC